MNSKYNRNTMTDMPLNASLDTVKSTPRTVSKSTETKSKINAIGKKATTKSASVGTKTSSTAKSTSATKKTTDNKDLLSSKKIKTDIQDDSFKKQDLKQTTKKSANVKTSKEAETLEKLNEESIRNYQAKSKRNKIVIVLLSVLLVVAIATIAIYISITRLKTNCTMHVSGADATYIINGKEITEFRTPANIQGYCVLKLDVQLRINETGEFKIKFKPECFENGVLLENIKITETDNDLFYDGEDGFYYSIGYIEGNQTIQLCYGIAIGSKYEDTLNVNNFRLDFYTYLEKKV